MKVDMTYGVYVAIMKAIEKAGPLAERGDADALEVVGRLSPAAALLGGRLTRKLAIAIAKMEEQPAGETKGRAGPKQAVAPTRPAARRKKLQYSVCRARLS